mmetsp:Transcript_318/g.1358  ORF Transcript_318/g.1358 Transcript_318/m.1358 type:complete len:206 (+) Transcript_318:54-671(+)
MGTHGFHGYQWFPSPHSCSLAELPGASGAEPWCVPETEPAVPRAVAGARRRAASLVGVLQDVDTDEAGNQDDRQEVQECRVRHLLLHRQVVVGALEITFRLQQFLLFLRSPRHLDFLIRFGALQEPPEGIVRAVVLADVAVFVLLLLVVTTKEPPQGARLGATSGDAPEGRVRRSHESLLEEASQVPDQDQGEGPLQRAGRAHGH